MKTLHQITRTLRGGSALQALALVGATVGGSAILAAPASAQDYTQISASGRVTDADGAAISGATVAITSDDQGFTRSVVTGADGSYRFANLPAGAYTFEITAPGFSIYRESGISLTREQSGNAFQLVSGTESPAATADGEIVVTGRRIQVADFERTTTGAVIEIGDLAQRVPVQRSLRDVVLLAPGTTQGGSAANGSFANQAQVSGSSFTENAYYVNGLNITEFRQGFLPVAIPFDFYETIEVKTGGFQAEFGRATGGVINAITKSGGNDFSGSVLFNYEPDWGRSDAPNSYTSDNDGDFSERYDSVFQLSGPIIKDRLFFYGIYNARYVETGNGSATAADPAGNRYTTQTTKSPFWGGKLDGIITDGHRVEFTYFDSTGESRNETNVYNSETNERGAFIGSTTSLSGGENYVGRYTGQFTDWLTVSGAYGKNKNRSATLPSNTTLERIRDIRSGTPVEIGNTSAAITTNDDERTFYRADVDLFVNLLGTHHFRFGYDREELDATQLSTTIGTGFLEYYVSAGASDRSGLPAGVEYVTARTFENGGTFGTVNEAFYLQDSWSLFSDRLTLQLGIRNDRFTNKDAAGVPFYESGDQWGPRIGVTLDPFGDGRTKVFGNFGRYFVPIAANTNIRGAGRELDYTRFNILEGVGADGRPIVGAPVLTVDNAQPCPDTGTANCTITADGSISDPTAFIAQGLKPQSLDEYILGVEQRIGSQWRVGLEFTYRELGEVLEDVAIDQAVLAYCEENGIEGCGAPGFFTGFHQYVLVNPGQDATIQLLPLPDGSTPVVDFTAEELGYPKAERYYTAVTLNVNREFDGVWSLAGSYTWAELRGNYEGGAKSDVGQTDTGATQDFDQPGLTNGAYGFLPGHRRHTFKLYGSYRIGDWFDIGANALVQSPKKFGCIGVVPASIDPFAQQYQAAGNYCQGELVPRGTAFESDWRKEVNLTAQLRLPVDFDASLRFDVFNIFNAKSELDFDEFGDLDNGDVNPNYRSPLVFQEPRSVRMQFRVGF